MTLQLLDRVVASVDTGPDGSYSFENLAAGYYMLAAWKNGFVGRYYGVNRPNGGAVANLHVPADSGAAVFNLQAEPAIAEMDSATLAQAHPDIRRNLGFEDGRFSPDGSEFAFGLSNVRSGATDEIWLYSLRDRSLRRVADRPGPFIWAANGKLYAWFVSDRKRYVVATAASIAEIDQPPSDIAEAFARWRPGRADARRVGGYLVSTGALGHGVLRLLVRSGGMPQAKVITDGSWELETLPPQSRSTSSDLSPDRVVRLSLTTFGPANRRRLIFNRAKTSGY